MQRKTQDRIDRIVVAVIAILILGLVLGLTLFVRAKAPCSWLNLLPAKDVPGRCLQVTVVRK